MIDDNQLHRQSSVNDRMNQRSRPQNQWLEGLQEDFSQRSVQDIRVEQNDNRSRSQHASRKSLRLFKAVHKKNIIKSDISPEQISAFSNNDVLSDDGLGDSGVPFKMGHQSPSISAKSAEEEKKSSNHEIPRIRSRIIANGRFLLKKKTSQGKNGKVFKALD